MGVGVNGRIGSQNQHDPALWPCSTHRQRERGASEEGLNFGLYWIFHF